jgi:hypothetical protein
MKTTPHHLPTELGVRVESDLQLLHAPRLQAILRSLTVLICEQPATPVRWQRVPRGWRLHLPIGDPILISASACQQASLVVAGVHKMGPQQAAREALATARKEHTR